jgi:hypothetical protein
MKLRHVCLHVEMHTYVHIEIVHAFHLFTLIYTDKQEKFAKEDSSKSELGDLCVKVYRDSA